MENKPSSQRAENRKIRIRIASGIAAFVAGIGLLTVGLIILPFVILLVGGVIALG